MSAFESGTLDELQVLLGDDLKTLLTLFHGESFRLLESMKTALTCDDREQLRMHAHSLKGASINLGAIDIHSCCFQIEEVALSASSTELHALLSELSGLQVDAADELSLRLASE